MKVDYGNNKGFVYRCDANGNLLSCTPLSQQPGRHRPAKPIAGSTKTDAESATSPSSP